MPEWFVSLVGGSFAPTLWIVFIAVLVCLLAVVVITLARRVIGFNTLGAQRGRVPRLAVVDMARIGDRRHLVLVRRDEIEHLLLIGGQNDVLVEPNILRVPAVARARAEREAVQQRGEEETVASPDAESDRLLPDIAGIIQRGRKAKGGKAPQPATRREEPHAPIAAASPEPRMRTGRDEDERPDAAHDTDPAVEERETAERPRPGHVSPSDETPRASETPAGTQDSGERRVARDKSSAAPSPEPTPQRLPEKQPLSVRSFVTAIQERQTLRPAKPAPAAAARPMSRAETPAPTPDRTSAPVGPAQMAAAGSTSAPARPAPPSPRPDPAPAAASSDDTKPAETETRPSSEQVDMRAAQAKTAPGDGPRAEPASAPTTDPAQGTTPSDADATPKPAETAPSTSAQAAPEPTAAPAVSVEPLRAQAVPRPNRRLTIEEEMRQLLGDFTLGDEDRVGQR